LFYACIITPCSHYCIYQDAAAATTTTTATISTTTTTTTTTSAFTQNQEIGEEHF
jgi:hypothetical protein